MTSGTKKNVIWKASAGRMSSRESRRYAGRRRLHRHRALADATPCSTIGVVAPPSAPRLSGRRSGSTPCREGGLRRWRREDAEIVDGPGQPTPAAPVANCWLPGRFCTRRIELLAAGRGHHVAAHLAGVGHLDARHRQRVRRPVRPSSTASVATSFSGRMVATTGSPGGERLHRPTDELVPFGRSHRRPRPTRRSTT